MGDIVNIPITIKSDDNGYFDRECPNEDCLYQFKIKLEDWKNNVSDNEVHCPLCGYVASADKWWTQSQLESINEIASSYAMNLLQSKLNKSFKEMEYHNNKFFKVSYIPSKRVSFINNPIGQSEEWQTEITCSKCNTRYSVIGTAYFCPCCGQNNIKSALLDSLESIEKMVDSLDDIEKLLNSSVGRDSAVDMSRMILGNTLEDIISLFQKYAETLFSEISSKKVRVNDFQIVDKGSQLFKDACGKDYSTWLDDTELEKMKLMFQKRHIVDHNASIVDSDYLRKSGDTSYAAGQRLVLHKNDVYELIRIVKKLSKGLTDECDKLQI